MSKTPKATGSEALSNFRTLEERVRRVILALRETREEKAELAGKLRQARTRIEILESEIRDLRKDRKTVRSRVEDLIRQISEVERANVKEEEKRVV